VFAVSGWADTGYAMNVPRLLENVHAQPAKGLIGPWGHRYFSYPGPNIDMLGQLRRWFGQWLRDEDNGCVADPQLIAYMQESSRPDAAATYLPGRWIAESVWPSKNISMRRYFINANGMDEQPQFEAAVVVKTPLTVGMTAGEWLPWYVAGAAPELAGDQRMDDGQSVCFDSSPLSEGFEFLGSPVAELELATDHPQTQVVIRLCEIFPDNASRLTTYGFLDLAHRDGDTVAAEVRPGRRIKVRVPLFPTGYAFRKGNRIRVAVSTSYWPVIWPTAVQPTLTLIAGKCHLELPERRVTSEMPVRELGQATAARGTPMTALRAPSTRQTLTRDVATEETTLAIEADLGRSRFDDRDIETDTVHRRSFRIRPHDPLSARAEMMWRMSLREGDWEIGTSIESTIFATERTFEIDTKLECSESGRPFHSRVFRSSIPRA
jgi:predicted acyl esterase